MVTVALLKVIVAGGPVVGTVTNHSASCRQYVDVEVTSFDSCCPVLRFEIWNVAAVELVAVIVSCTVSPAVYEKSANELPPYS